eukprot:jgi/Picsp_1/4686/NSC_02055-R1_multicopper oxidase type 2
MFLVLKGRLQEDENSPGESNAFCSRLPDDHLPGIHWYHPHKHGSTSTQTMGAQGTILVEDGGELWLPDENGCKDFREALSSMKDRIMHMATYGSHAGCMRVIDFVRQGEIDEDGVCSTKMPVPGTVAVA